MHRIGICILILIHICICIYILSFVFCSLSVAARMARKIGRIPCSMDRLKRPGEEIGAMLITFIFPVMVNLVMVTLILVAYWCW